jgi:hypothetical protein
MNRFKDWLMEHASWHTILWCDMVSQQFPRERPKPTDMGKTSAITHAALHNENGKLIYRT